MLVLPFLAAATGAGMLAAMLMPLLMLPLTLVLYLVVVPFVRVVSSNLLWNHTRLGDTRFRSTQAVGSYLKLVLGNWLLTLLTLGFYWPVAQVKLAAYRARHLTVLDPTALGQAVAAAGACPAAVGDEVVDAFDFDIAL